MASACCPACRSCLSGCWGAGSGLLAWRIYQVNKSAVKTAEAMPAPAAPTEETPASSLAMDEVRIELGFALLPLINDVQGRRLTDQIKALRKTLAQDLGFVMPSVRILDNVQLAPDAYCVRVREMDAGEGKLRIGQLLAMDPNGARYRHSRRASEGACVRSRRRFGSTNARARKPVSAATPWSIPRRSFPRISPRSSRSICRSCSPSRK
ncbi:MAG: FHIPEP family type III secretion protein [Terricaulis sp.]